MPLLFSRVHCPVRGFAQHDEPGAVLIEKVNRSCTIEAFASNGNYDWVRLTDDANDVHLCAQFSIIRGHNPLKIV